MIKPISECFIDLIAGSVMKYNSQTYTLSGAVAFSLVL